jgi:hypothetical protein
LKNNLAIQQKMNNMRLVKRKKSGGVKVPPDRDKLVKIPKFDRSPFVIA